MPNLDGSTMYYSMLSAPITNATYGGIQYDFIYSKFNQQKYLIFCLARCANDTVPSYPGNDSECALCSSNCLECRIASNCSKCQLGFYIDQNYSCVACYNTFQDCNLCSSNSCSLCLIGFALELVGGTKKCRRCNSIIFNCEICSFIGSNITCDECFIQSYIYHPCSNQNCSSMCLPCLDQCLSCTNSSSCLTCKIGYQVSGGCTDIKTCLRVDSNQSYLTSRCLQC